LNAIGHRLGDEKAYWDYRDKRVRVPDTLQNIREVFSAAELTTHALIKTIEWIPLERVTEFLPYWESGGKKLLLRREGLNEEEYANFHNWLGDAVKRPDRLAALGIKTFAGAEDQDQYVLLPTFHIYHIAQFRTPPNGVQNNHDDLRSTESIMFPLKTVAAFNARSLSNSSARLQAAAKVIEEFLTKQQRRFIYLAGIEAGGGRRLIDLSTFGEEYKERKPITLEGRNLELPTITTVILDSNSGSGAGDILGAFAHVTELGRANVYWRNAMDVDAPAARHLLDFVLLWPDITLKSIEGKDQNEALREILRLSCRSGEWPRLITQSDAAFIAACRMEPEDNKLPDHTGPLRYFVWQSRVAAPAPFSFLVLPQSVSSLGPGGSRTGFLMWQDPVRSCTHATIQDCILLMAIQPLAVLEIAERAGREGLEEGLEKAIVDFSHEVVAFTDALLLSRTPQLSHVFEINGYQPASRDSRRGWPVPAGRIVVPKSHEEQICSWRVCTTPKLTDGLKNQLLLWGGSRCWREEAGLGNTILFVDALKQIVEIARYAASAAEMLRSASPKSLEDSVQQERDFTAILNTMQQVADPIFSGPQLEWVGGVETNPPHCEFIRLVVAALTNAFKHTQDPESQVHLKVYARSEGFEMCIENTRERVGTDKDEGTKAVIRRCVTRLGGSPSEVKFQELPPDPSGHLWWFTRFALPYNRYAGKEVTWLKLGL
jgi:hypothetical protein